MSRSLLYYLVKGLVTALAGRVELRTVRDDLAPQMGLDTRYRGQPRLLDCFNDLMGRDFIAVAYCTCFP